MKKVIILITVAFATINLGYSQFADIASTTHVSLTQKVRTVNTMFLTVPISDNWSFTSFMLETTSWSTDAGEWAEIILGPTYKHNNLSIGLGVGLEDHVDKWRSQVSFVYNPPKIFVLAIGEYGASGHWWTAQLQYKTKIHEKTTIKVGLFSRRFYLSGPRVDLTWKGWALWTAAGKNFQRSGDESWGAMVGLSFFPMRYLKK